MFRRKKQPIKIGLSDGLNVEVTEGLKLQDKVIDKLEDDNSNKASARPRRAPHPR